jgi:hypothetical protein
VTSAAHFGSLQHAHFHLDISPCGLTLCGMKQPMEFLLWMAGAILISPALRGAEPEPFAPQPLRLETAPVPVSTAHPITVPLPVGPVVLDHGIPIRANGGSSGRALPLLDAPGRGYQTLQERFR